jgi:hypothetical protein
LPWGGQTSIEVPKVNQRPWHQLLWKGQQRYRLLQLRLVTNQRLVSSFTSETLQFYGNQNFNPLLLSRQQKRNIHTRSTLDCSLLREWGLTMNMPTTLWCDKHHHIRDQVEKGDIVLDIPVDTHKKPCKP